jgi:energy-coupling factor transport system ATP-binding protein
MSIAVQELSYIYMKGTPYEKLALNNINLNIDNGEFVGIIGHTGSGKSTLVQHFNGLLKPSSGKIIINGIDTTQKNLMELRKQVGLVFQYPEYQLFEETVYKDVAFGLAKLGLSKEEIESSILNAITSVGLGTDILDKSPFELSGGQKRRVAIAGIVAMNPKILILDEPAAGLDPRGRNEIFSLIKELHRNRKITVVLISHSMEDIARLVERVIVISKGSIEMNGTPSEIFKKTERLREIGLSAPQVTYLMKKLKKVIPDIDDNIFTIEAAKKEILGYIKRGKND